jgi:hypothetical protein
MEFSWGISKTQQMTDDLDETEMLDRNSCKNTRLLPVLPDKSSL